MPKSSNFVKSRKNVIFGHFVGGLGLGGRYQHIHGRKFGVAKFKQKGLVINRIIEFYSIGFFVKGGGGSP